MQWKTVINGTGKNAKLDRPTAGKTGTVELPDTEEFSGISGGVKDVWFIGYTPELTAAVWMGYDHTDRNHYLTTSGGSEPAQVFHEILSRALESTPVVPFEIPQEYIDSINYLTKSPTGSRKNLNKRIKVKKKKKKKGKSDKNIESQLILI